MMRNTDPEYNFAEPLNKYFESLFERFNIKSKPVESVEIIDLNEGEDFTVIESNINKNNL